MSENWEDLLRDKLENFEQPLPEGDLAVFRERLDAAGVARKTKSGRRLLFMVIPSLAAAGLTLFLLVHAPSEEWSGTGSVELAEVTARSDEAGVEASDDDAVAGTLEEASAGSLAEAHVTSSPVETPEPRRTEVPQGAVSGEMQAARPETVPEESDPGRADRSAADEAARPGADVSGQTLTMETADETPAGQAVVETGDVWTGPSAESLSVAGADDASTPRPARYRSTVKRSRVRSLVSSSAGTLAAAAVTSLLVNGTGAPVSSFSQQTAVSPSSMAYYCEFSGTGQRVVAANVTAAETEAWHASYSHSMPPAVGLSFQKLFNRKFSLTFGLEYRRYHSSFHRTPTQTWQQDVHYLNVPVRLDWTLLRNGRFECYAGAGVSPAICLAATLHGNRLNRDGLSWSVEGAAGMQYRIVSPVALFLEPKMSWNLPWGEQNLETYRSAHPLMVSGTAGIRFSI